MASPVLRLVRRVVACSLVAILALTTHAAWSPTAAAASTSSPSSTSAESEFLRLLNQARTQSGLPALQYDGPLVETSRSWSSNMASQSRLYHDPNLATVVARVEPKWRSAGENVGVGYGVQQLHDAFMDSPGHRANVMSTRFNRAGIGVVYAGTKIWVTVRFIEGPVLATASSAPSAPAPVPVGVRTALSGDFDGDGLDDLLTYGPGAERDELWFGQHGQSMRKVSVSISGQYQPVAGDFDGDGRSEILWYAPGSDADYVWDWNGSGWDSTRKTINGTYTARAGDFDADGVDDILWYAPGGGADYLWYGSRAATFSSQAVTVSGTYVPVVGDFNGDGGDDVLWYGRGSAPDALWFSTGERGAFRSQSVSAGGAHTPFAGDFDGNGVDDLFFYTPGSAPDVTWFNTTTAFASTKAGRSVNGTYVPAAGDFSGNGVDDVIWFSPSGAAGDPIWWGVMATTSYSSSSLRAG